MSRKPDPKLETLELPAYFPENSVSSMAPTEPNVNLTSLELPHRDLLAGDLPLPLDSRVPRIAFADDDKHFLRGVETSASSERAALDVRCWAPDQLNLVAWLRKQRDGGWMPDLLVLDINLDDGGRTGHEYLADLRRMEGFLALTIVLATGGSLREAPIYDAGNHVPAIGRLKAASWLSDARISEPEAILYGKQADRAFLRRLLENLPVWHEAARRRTWNVLLSRVAQQLDGEAPTPEMVGALIVDFAGKELGVSDVFIGWRQPTGLYRLVARRTSWGYDKVPNDLSPSAVPFLFRLTEGNHEPIIFNDGLSAGESGDLKSSFAAKKAIGAAAVMRNQSIGFMAMLRESDEPDFDKYIDAEAMALLARLLAAALGRAETIRLSRERDRDLLTFAGQLAKSRDAIEVSNALVRLVHKSVNGGDDQNANVVVRLANWATGELEQAAAVGRPSIACPIYLWAKGSMITRVITRRESERCPDVQAPEWRDQCLDSSTAPGVVRSETCVPLLSGEGAVGALAAEHTTVDRYRNEDVEFMESAAGLASAALARIRLAGFVNQVVEFASDFAKRPAGELGVQLRRTLQEFSGASAIVRLRAPRDAESDHAWSVDDVAVQLHGGDAAMLEQSLRSLYVKQWRDTTLHDWISKQVWNDSLCSFSHDSVRQPTLRGTDEGDGFEGLERAMAVLWLRRTGQQVPYAALLLLWFFRPPLSTEDTESLARVAAMLAALEERESSVKTWMKTAIQGEQAALAGFQQQHFRHRMRSDLGMMKGEVELLLVHAQKLALPKIEELASRLDQHLRLISEGFKKANAYVKAPAIEHFDLRSSHATVLGDLSGRLDAIEVTDGTPEGLFVWGDRLIYELTLFTLLENCADALAERTDGTVVIAVRHCTGEPTVVSVQDNGQGIDPDFMEELFTFGVTTKRQGLGSALAFSKARMELFNGGLRLASGSIEGACFEIVLPASYSDAQPNEFPSLGDGSN